jgi:choline dehydrogenase-like flavoprotein
MLSRTYSPTARGAMMSSVHRTIRVGAKPRGGRERSPAASAERPSARRKAYDYLIVDAGLAASVLAERFASQRGKSVLLIDRPYIRGNPFDETNSPGVLMHRYGPPHLTPDHALARRIQKRTPLPPLVTPSENDRCAEGAPGSRPQWGR